MSKFVCKNCKKDDVNYEEFDFDYYHAEDCRETDESKCHCSSCGVDFSDGDVVYIEL